MTPQATIILPTHNHGALLRSSVTSALQQTVPVEIFIIGDGVDPETRTVATQMAVEFDCVTFFDNPKGPRHGEIHRDVALQHARAPFVCYLADDDLYVPSHVEHVCQLLETADFVHAFAVRVAPDGSFSAWTVDLSEAAFRQELSAGRNRVPFSAGAHTLSFYRQLAEGWTSAPPDLASDLHMWQKFLQQPECRFVAGRWPTVYVLPSPLRHHMTSRQRDRELREWLARLSSPAGTAVVERELLAQKRAEAANLESRFLSSQAGLRSIGALRSILQVFYPSATGYSERQSTFREIRVGHWEEHSIELPPFNSGHPLRIDPANVPGLVAFTALELRDSAGGLLWALTPENAAELRLVHELVRTSSDPLVLVSQGNDPQLLLPATLPMGEALTLKVKLRVSDDLLEIVRSFV